MNLAKGSANGQVAAAAELLHIVVELCFVQRDSLGGYLALYLLYARSKDCGNFRKPSS